MGLLKNTARIIVALIFIYSGFVKGVDPMGSAIKFTDYFNAFGIGWLNPAALALAVGLSSLEFVLGVCLFLKINIKPSAIITFGLTAFFTLLTLILAIKNPVSDCGCFGNAIILTNWETFWKNVILLLLSFVVFIKRDNFKINWTAIDRYFWTTTAFIFIVCVSVYSLRHLPILDFRPYHVGADIHEQMTIPEGAKLDTYKSVFKYKNKNSGEIKEFTEDNYPWKDSLTWEYVEIRQELIEEGYKAPIHTFNIEHPVRGNIGNEILEDENYTFLLIADNLNKTDTDNINGINILADYCINKGYSFYGLTASLDNDIDKFKKNNNVHFEFCNMDETQLKTIVRSNPGLVLIRKGTIINKWHYNDIPNAEEIKNKELSSYCINNQRKVAENHSIIIFLLMWGTGLYFYIMKRYKKRAR